MGYQHNGEETFAALTAATRTDFWGLLASITYRDSDDLKDGDGLIIANSGDEILAGLLKNSWTLGDSHRLTLSWQAFNDDHRLPSAANTAATTNIVDRTTRQNTAVLRWQYQPTDSALWNVDAHFYYNRIALDERRISDGRFDETELDTFGVAMSI
jgi:hemoglobin/transferrin/lactoferrin receptor protein